MQWNLVLLNNLGSVDSRGIIAENPVLDIERKDALMI